MTGVVFSRSCVFVFICTFVFCLCNYCNSCGQLRSVWIFWWERRLWSVFHHSHSSHVPPCPSGKTLGWSSSSSWSSWCWGWWRWCQISFWQSVVTGGWTPSTSSWVQTMTRVAPGLLQWLLSGFCLQTFIIIIINLDCSGQTLAKGVVALIRRRGAEPFWGNRVIGITPGNMPFWGSTNNYQCPDEERWQLRCEFNCKDCLFADTQPAFVQHLHPSLKYKKITICWRFPFWGGLSLYIKMSS